MFVPSQARDSDQGLQLSLQVTMGWNIQKQLLREVWDGTAEDYVQVHEDTDG